MPKMPIDTKRGAGTWVGLDLLGPRLLMLQGETAAAVNRRHGNAREPGVEDARTGRTRASP